MRDLDYQSPLSTFLLAPQLFIYLFICSAIVGISARAPFECDEFNLYVFFQHVEGPECQLHGQLGLHTFTSCLAERTQVSRDLLIVTDSREERRGGGWFHWKCRLWCNTPA